VEFKEEKNGRETIILFLVKVVAIGVDRMENHLYLPDEDMNLSAW